MILIYIHNKYSNRNRGKLMKELIRKKVKITSEIIDVNRAIIYLESVFNNHLKYKLTIRGYN